MRHHQWPSQDGWHALGQIASQEGAIISNSICSLENLINFFYPTWWWWPEVTHFFAYSAKEGRKWITKQVALKKPILY